MDAEDFGIKLLKPGAALDSTDPDDYIFISSIRSLPLIQSTIVQKEVSNADCVGSFLYEHNLGFFAFTLVTILDTFNENLNFSGGNGNLLPYSFSSPSKRCDSARFSEDFSYKIHEDDVEIFYDVECIIPMVGGSCPEDGFPFGGPYTYNFKIDIYNLELGV